MTEEMFIKILQLDQEERYIASKKQLVEEIERLNNKILELEEDGKSWQGWANKYMNRMLEAREDNMQVRKAYANTRQTLSNIGLGMLKGEDQQIAMNEVSNIDKTLATYVSHCTCIQDITNMDKTTVAKDCPLHGE